MNIYSVNRNHRLMHNGSDVDFRAANASRGQSMPIRRALVIHYTQGWSAESTIHWWNQSEAAGVCAHIIIDRDGSVFQCRRFNETAGHAGASRWLNPTTGRLHRGLNSCSIGMELCNAGILKQDNYPTAMGSTGLAGKPIPFVQAAHKHGGPVQNWETFSLPPLDAAKAVARALCERYKLDDVLGHDDVAAGRKQDPGPAFPMAEFRQSLGFSHPLQSIWIH